MNDKNKKRNDIWLTIRAKFTMANNEAIPYHGIN